MKCMVGRRYDFQTRTPELDECDGLLGKLDTVTSDREGIRNDARCFKCGAIHGSMKHGHIILNPSERAKVLHHYNQDCDECGGEGFKTIRIAYPCEKCEMTGTIKRRREHYGSLGDKTQQHITAMYNKELLHTKVHVIEVADEEDLMDGLVDILNPHHDGLLDGSKKIRIIVEITEPDDNTD